MNAATRRTCGRRTKSSSCRMAFENETVLRRVDSCAAAMQPRRPAVVKPTLIAFRVETLVLAGHRRGAVLSGSDTSRRFGHSTAQSVVGEQGFHRFAQRVG